MSHLLYRELQRQEAELLGRIDRSERIDGIYRCVAGALVLDSTWSEDVPSWRAPELDALVARLQALLASGGHCYGAWDGADIVGVAALDVRGVNGNGSILGLDMLYVSTGHRGRGIGRRLTELIALKARSRGADGLYISATPTRNTVDAYLHMGARLVDLPDPESLAREPDDIHLIMRIR